nr:proline-rich protein HaeIII subfamily 1-like [Camelus dromedarius]
MGPPRISWGSPPRGRRPVSVGGPRPEGSGSREQAQGPPRWAGRVWETRVRGARRDALTNRGPTAGPRAPPRADGRDRRRPPRSSRHPRHPRSNQPPRRPHRSHCHNADYGPRVRAHDRGGAGRLPVARPADTELLRDPVPLLTPRRRRGPDAGETVPTPVAPTQPPSPAPTPNPASSRSPGAAASQRRFHLPDARVCVGDRPRDEGSPALPEGPGPRPPREPRPPPRGPLPSAVAAAPRRPPRAVLRGLAAVCAPRGADRLARHKGRSSAARAKGSALGKGEPRSPCGFFVVCST